MTTLCRVLSRTHAFHLAECKTDVRQSMIALPHVGLWIDRRLLFEINGVDRSRDAQQRMDVPCPQGIERNYAGLTFSAARALGTAAFVNETF